MAARHAVDDVPLEPVGVLVLVDEDVVVGAHELRRGLRDLLEQALPGEQQVVVVAGVGGPLPLLERREVRRALEEHFREGAAGVDRVGIEIEQHVPLGEPPLDDRDLVVRGRRLEHLAGILGVEDREVRTQTDAAPEPAQQPVPDGMERPAHQAPRVHRQERLDPAQHVPRGSVGEGQEEDPPRIRAGFDQAGHTVNEGAGLARARAGDDQDRPPAGQDDLPLLVVQLPVVVHAVGVRPGGGLQDVFALHRASVMASRHVISVSSHSS